MNDTVSRFAESAASTKFILRPGWFARALDGALVLTSDTRSYRVHLSRPAPAFLDALVSDGVSGTGNYDGLTPVVLRSLIEELSARELLLAVPDMHARGSASGFDQYLRHLGVSPAAAHSALAEATVLVLGLGGTGTAVLEHLVAAGVSRFGFVDPDQVEDGNLERQFIYSQGDIGTWKTDAATAYVTSRSPGAQARTLKRFLTSTVDVNDVIDWFGAPTICVVCVDNPPAAVYSVVSETLWRRSVPFIHGGVLSRSGFYGPLFAKGISPAAPAQFTLDSRVDEGDAVQPTTIAFSPYNSIIGASIAAETLHFLIGEIELVDVARRTFVDFANCRFHKLGPNAAGGQLEMGPTP